MIKDYTYYFVWDSLIAKKGTMRECVTKLNEYKEKYGNKHTYTLYKVQKLYHEEKEHFK